MADRLATVVQKVGTVISPQPCDPGGDVVAIRSQQTVVHILNTSDEVRTATNRMTAPSADEVAAPSADRVLSIPPGGVGILSWNRWPHWKDREGRLHLEYDNAEGLEIYVVRVF